MNAEVRFIEYMDVGGATPLVAASASCRAARCSTLLAAQYGAIEPIVEEARRRRPSGSRSPDGTMFGIISSTTEPFCRTCDRSRLTADGMWYLCLYARAGMDLRGAAARAARRADGARAIIAAAGRARDDRGAEERLALGDRRAFVPVQDLLEAGSAPRDAHAGRLERAVRRSALRRLLDAAGQQQRHRLQKARDVTVFPGMPRQPTASPSL